MAGANVITHRDVKTRLGGTTAAQTGGKPCLEYDARVTQCKQSVLFRRNVADLGRIRLMGKR